MKKAISLLLSGVLLCLCLSGCGCRHEWQDASCTEPKTCTQCGKTDGESLGHTVIEWTVTKESSCTEHGTEAGRCTVCGAQTERETELKAHTLGDWFVLEEPTETKNGVRVIQCTVCGEEFDREVFSLSPEELRRLYISRCQSISYDSLARSPDAYKGTPVKLSGKVVQVCSEASSALYYSTYRVATSGSYNNVVYIKVDNYGADERILEDDWITFYGDYDGLYTYTTVLGASITIPSVKVRYLG